MKNTINVERARHNLTQKQLAKELGVCNITIHNIETGKQDPRTELALKLANFFKVDIRELFQLDK